MSLFTGDGNDDIVGSPQKPGRDRDELHELLGQKRMARDLDCRAALQTRIAVLDRFTALGIPGTHPTG